MMKNLKLRNPLKGGGRSPKDYIGLQGGGGDTPKDYIRLQGGYYDKP